jgi:hypothetical protein
VLAAAVAAGGPMSAHRTDEYLQAARLDIQPDRTRIELDLTPGIAVADAVLAEIDTDRNGSISQDEARTYVARVLTGITVDVDGARLTMQAGNCTFPAVEAMRNGEGTIRIDLLASMPHLGAGPHHLNYRNTNRRDIGVYLANALVPESDRVAVTGQDRDTDQHDLSVAYVLQAELPAGRNEWSLAASAAGLLALALGVRRLFRRRDTAGLNVRGPLTYRGCGRCDYESGVGADTTVCDS